MLSFKQHLNEIGDSNRPYKHGPIKIKKERGAFFKATVKFKTDNDKFEINLNTLMDLTEVDFYSDQFGFEASDAGLQQAFKIIATVMKVTKEYLHLLNDEYGHKSNVIISNAENAVKKNRNKGEQRTRLYLQFAKKQLKQVKSVESQGTKMKITLKDSFYK